MKSNKALHDLVLSMIKDIQDHHGLDLIVDSVEYRFTYPEFPHIPVSIVVGGALTDYEGEGELH